MPRRWLAALALCGLWAAFGTACDSGPRRREPGEGSPAATHAAPAAVPARVAAIGDTSLLAPNLRRAFDQNGFEPMPAPGPDDWLARHRETPQSFADYARGLRKLQSAIRFDPTAREEALAAAFGRLGIDDEAAWSAARATWIRDGVRTVR